MPETRLRKDLPMLYILEKAHNKFERQIGLWDQIQPMLTNWPKGVNRWSLRPFPDDFTHPSFTTPSIFGVKMNGKKRKCMEKMGDERTDVNLRLSTLSEWFLSGAYNGLWDLINPLVFRVIKYNHCLYLLSFPSLPLEPTDMWHIKDNIFFLCTYF